MTERMSMTPSGEEREDEPQRLVRSIHRSCTLDNCMGSQSNAAWSMTPALKGASVAVLCLIVGFLWGWIAAMHDRSYAHGIVRGEYQAFETAATVVSSGYCEKCCVEWFRRQAASRP